MDSLAAVAEEIRGCTRCPLAATRLNAVPGEGPADARLFLAGEAPGATEDRLGLPFRGAAGRHLEAALAAAGAARDDVFIGSVCRCRPPGNRNPRPAEIEACASYLDRQLALVAPRIVLAMGLTAAVRLGFASKSERMADVRLRRLSPGAGRPFTLLATYHPAAAMRFPALRQPFADDLAIAVRAAGVD